MECITKDFSNLTLNIKREELKEYKYTFYQENINKIIIIQSLVRRYLVDKYILIPPSFYQTKIWRKTSPLFS